MEETSKNLWKIEYERRGIPSSFRLTPTKHVVDFCDFLKKQGIVAGHALDLGSGKGRNGFFLAQRGYTVDALELIPANVAYINQEASREGLFVNAKEQDLSNPWSCESACYDFAIDIFCYKHIVSKAGQAHYRNELKRCLKKKGYFLINCAADDDGFYGPLLQSSKNPSIKYIEDPFSGIPSLLYNLEEIIIEFSSFLELVEAKKVSSESPMYGKEYTRSVLSLIFQNR